MISKKENEKITANLLPNILTEFGLFHQDYVLAMYYKYGKEYKTKLVEAEKLEHMIKFMKNYKWDDEEEETSRLCGIYERGTKTALESYVDNWEDLQYFEKQRQDGEILVIGLTFQAFNVKVNTPIKLAASKWIRVFTKQEVKEEMGRKIFSSLVAAQVYKFKEETSEKQEVKKELSEEEIKRKEAIRKRQEENRIRNINKTKKARKTKKNVYG